MTCEHLQHHDEGRHPNTCVKCDRPIAEGPSLPEHVERMFRHLAEALESAGQKPRDLPCPDFDAFKAVTTYRVNVGQREYGEAWRSRDNIREALEELPDAMVYGVADAAQSGEIDADVLDGIYHAYLSFAAFRRRQARGR